MSSSSSASRPSTEHIPFRSSTFEDTESIDEVEHKITAQRIVFSIADATCCDCSRNIASLLQDIINLEPQCSLIVFQERF